MRADLDNPLSLKDLSALVERDTWRIVGDIKPTCSSKDAITTAYARFERAEQLVRTRRSAAHASLRAHRRSF
ncbi:hypothetical protein ACFQ60_47765 [Streptomyces zhihengii]